MATRKTIIEQRLQNRLLLSHLEVIDESGNHNVPAGAESHFKVVAVAKDFEGKKLIERHRAINAILSDLLENGIHALALHTYTEAEWALKFGDAPKSPPCLGGSKTTTEKQS